MFPAVLALPFVLFAACLPGSSEPVDPSALAASCSIHPPGGGPLRLLEGCARLDDDGGLRVSPEALTELTFDGELASLYVGEVHRWFYVNREGVGLSCHEQGFDCAPFHDGLTSGMRDGKVVFYGPDLQVAFATGFDWAGSFEDGLAPVCEGIPTSPEGGGDCDQGEPSGGLCGYVDTDGRVVMEPSVPLEALPEPESLAL